MNAASPRPILATDRVSDVLARDDALVEVFVRYSDHFTKLRSPALRRVMARLITVEEAARVANTPLAALLADLNAAVGAAPSAPVDGGSATAAEPGDVHPVGAPVVELDVREALRTGEEPFSRIMAAVGALPDDGVLHLRAIFEPAPLYTVLARRGFAHETRAHAPDDWSVWFWRPAAPPSASVGASAGDATPPAFASERAPDEQGPDERWLDVRGLEPPEPMRRTLAALETLPAGQTLVQVNVRVPQFLLPVLAERGFAFAIDESVPDRVLVRIRRAG